MDYILVQLKIDIFFLAVLVILMEYIYNNYDFHILIYLIFDNYMDYIYKIGLYIQN